MTGEFWSGGGEADVSRLHRVERKEGGVREAGRGWRGRYKRQTERGIVALCVCERVCLCS